MFKFSYSMAIFCMLCSSVLPSLHAECPCCKKPPRKQIVNPIIITDQEQQELAH
jgi:hypothetical protein